MRSRRQFFLTTGAAAIGFLALPGNAVMRDGHPSISWAKAFAGNGNGNSGNGNGNGGSNGGNGNGGGSQGSGSGGSNGNGGNSGSGSNGNGGSAGNGSGAGNGNAGGSDGDEAGSGKGAADAAGRGGAEPAARGTKNDDGVTTAATPAPNRPDGDRPLSVRHANGTVERINGGRYEMRDAKSRTIVNRRATSSDRARLEQFNR